MISEDRLQKALTFLAQTDEDAAKAKALMIGLEKQEKSILAAAFMDAEGTVAERDARSRLDPLYKEWRDKYEEAVTVYEHTRNKRITEALMVEVFRTMSANQRRGNV